MAEQINTILQDCMGSLGDDGVVLVQLESLMPISGYVHVGKAKANFEKIVAHVKKLPEKFLESEGGWSFLNLPFLASESGRAGEQWGGQDHAAVLCLLCEHYGIFQDPLYTIGFKKDSLGDLPGGVSFISFNVEDEFLNLVRHQLGLK